MADYGSDSDEDEFQSADEGDDEEIITKTEPGSMTSNPADVGLQSTDVVDRKCEQPTSEESKVDCKEDRQEQLTVKGATSEVVECPQEANPEVTTPRGTVQVEAESQYPEIGEAEPAEGIIAEVENPQIPSPDNEEKTLSVPGPAEQANKQNESASEELSRVNSEKCSIPNKSPAQSSAGEQADGANEKDNETDGSAKKDSRTSIDKETDVLQQPRPAESNKFEAEDAKDVIVEQPKSQPLDDPIPKETQAPDEWASDGWGWDTFENVISSATTKVSAAVEKVEASLGIPTPHELASTDTNSEQAADEAEGAADAEAHPDKGEPIQPQQAAGLGSWFSGFGSHLTSAVQKTSQDLVTGSVGALEFIGKKTFDALSEGDPGLRKKRGKGSLSLSQVLREAQEHVESAEHSGGLASAGLSFTAEFERFGGMDNLQTLEILSNESEKKLDRILNIQSEDALDESKEILLILTKNFTLHEGSSVDTNSLNFGENLRKNCEAMRGKATLSVERLLTTHGRLVEGFKHAQTDGDDLEQAADSCFKFAISGLAEMTARCLELSRKTAEVLCADDVKAKSMCLTRASLFRKNSEILRNELSSLSSMFAHGLDDVATKSKSRRVSFLVTDVHLEGANCCTYMEDCHRLVLPILQVSAIR